MKSFSELTSASQVNNGDLLAISQTSGSGYASKKTTVKDITDKSNLNLAEEYDSTSTYAVDDYVIYESVLYKCISATTGTFDSTKWTSVVVTDEMGSGGGGTGGHTIIDENGTSMTARAGLQFVGANVSDDSTNNKTIVDLASAGGIDGVFIDTENVIQSATSIPSGTSTYTATEDCVVTYQLVATESGCNIQINDNIVDGLLTGSNYNVVSGNAYLKKGQVIKFVQTSTDAGTYTVYGIQTGTTHSKFQPVIYSTEEREIGVWEDGKPLYEKTIDLGNTVSISYNSWTLLDYDISNIETLVCCNTPNYGSLMVGKNPNGKIQGQTTRNNDTVQVRYLTIQYTKTSDTAGSGSWTPQGVPTHHYSTDEQIVGTWIDGKTLYEKTFDLGSDLVVPYNNWVSLGITLDANKIIETKTTATVGSFQGNILMYNDNGTWKGTSPRNNDGSYVRYLTIQYTKSS